MKTRVRLGVRGCVAACAALAAGVRFGATVHAQAAVERPVHVGFEVVGWSTSLDGEGRADTDGVRGSTVDLVETLGIEDDPNLVEFRGWIELARRHRLVVDYLDISLDGHARLEQEITFSGVGYFFSDVIRSSLDLTSIQFQYQLALLAAPERRFDLGLLAGAEYLDVDASVSSSLAGTSSASGEAFAPVLGAFARGRLGPDWLELRGELVGSKFDISGVDVSYLRLLLDVGVAFTPYTVLRGGYRFLHAEGEQDDLFAEVELQGPTLSFEARF